MPVTPYDAVLCDIDGVLRHWPPFTSLEREHQLAEGCFAAAAFGTESLRHAVTGRITDEQWRAAVAGELAEICGSVARARAAVAAWAAVVPRVDQEAVALLIRARAVASVVLVSNATTRLEDDLARQGLSGVADAVVNTARIGFAKPDPRVYRIAAERAGARPGRCLFVDDTEANVAAAREAGMAGVLHRRTGDLRRALGPLFGAEAGGG